MLRRPLSRRAAAVLLALLAGASAAGCGTETSGSAPEADTGADTTAGPDLSLPPNPSIVGGLGSGCLNDEDCADPDLVCAIQNAGGVCTKACHDAESQTDEQPQCDGVGTTCLTAQPDIDGFCYRSCEADVALGDDRACPDGQMCTGWWWQRGTPDRSGCVPWCSDDAPCAPHRVCEPRLGACIEPSFPAPADARRDGEPCSVSARLANGRSADCLGDCFFLDATDNGVCASFIDLSRTSECPDDPSTMEPLTRGDDNVGICIYRRCEASDDCTAPLECKLCPTNGLPNADRCCLPP